LPVGTARDRTLPDSCSVLANHVSVSSLEKGPEGKILARLAVWGTLDRDGLEREFFQPGRHIAVAPLAGDEGLAV
jgi:hypothetical protein